MKIRFRFHATGEEVKPKNEYFFDRPIGVILKELENNFFIFFLELFSSLEKKRIAARIGTATQCQFL